MPPSPLPPDHPDRLARARLSLDGLSVGDALGERFFGPAPDALARIARRALPRAPWRYTDDTEMALSVVETLARRGAIDPDLLAANFARRFDVHRGYGGTAYRILVELREGRPWREVAPAVFGGEGSMGNGSAMRVAPVGAYFADDLDRVVVEAERSAAVTHAHPEGRAGAVAIAVAAALAARPDGPREAGPFLEAVRARVPDGATREGIERAAALDLATTSSAAAAALGSGQQVTCPDTVPFALWSAARHLGSYEDAFWATLEGLGDRDTTCAIVGGIVALSAGRASIPAAWIAAREALPPV